MSWFIPPYAWLPVVFVVLMTSQANAAPNTARAVSRGSVVEAPAGTGDYVFHSAPMPEPKGRRLPVEVGLRMSGHDAQEMPAGVGASGLWHVYPQLGFGVAFTHFVMIPDGDATHYCHDCVHRTSVSGLLVEGRLLPELFVSPYARVSPGFAGVTGNPPGEPGAIRTMTEDSHAFAVGAELGVDVHFSVMSLRLFGEKTCMVYEYSEACFDTLGGQVGVVF